MTSKSVAASGKSGPVVGFSHLRHLLSCDACGEKNPPKCCARCRAVYYCSVTCQRAHWKQHHQSHCLTFENSRSKCGYERDASEGLCLDLSVFENAFARDAVLLVAQADRFPKGSKEMKDGYRLALAEVETILEAESEHRDALSLKANILVALDEPWKAIKICKAFLQEGDDRLTVHYCLAQAYEAVGIWTEAQIEYCTTIQGCVQANSESMTIGDITIGSFLGLSRVCCRLEDYDTAVHFAGRVVRDNRAAPGAHKHLALALLAMAKLPNAPDRVHGHSPTLAGAIEVAYKGFVYEAQWHDPNKQVNKKFLLELLEQASSCEDAAFVA
jgi:tetratricopeptide (TPR) repeat protein